ncbi:MAG: flavodoxin family protein [Marinifilaceae bacterium]|jgi:multimeric flavodoxin WrbA|nr:flavodoxin family protein [Marinifilaceae bacterium]
MKILVINGSPRSNGNNGKILSEFFRQGRLLNHELESINLSEKNISCCQACLECKARDIAQCSQNDDMNSLLTKIDKADALIIGSPIYMWHVNAQTKLFIDRLMPFLNSDYSSRLKSQKVINVYTQANSNSELYKKHLESMSEVYSFIGFKHVDNLYVSGELNTYDAWTQNGIESKVGELLAKL